MPCTAPRTRTSRSSESLGIRRPRSTRREATMSSSTSGRTSGPADHRARGRGQPRQGCGRPGRPVLQHRPRPARDGRPRAAAAGAVDGGLDAVVADPAGRRATGRPAAVPSRRRRDQGVVGRTSVSIVAQAPPRRVLRNAFAAAVKLSRANLRPRRATRVALRRRVEAVIRPAGVRTRRPEPPVTRTRRRSGRSSHRAWASRRRVSCTSRRGSSGPVCRSISSVRVSPSCAGLAEDDAARWRSPKPRTTDSVAKVATTSLVLPAPDGEPVTVSVTGIAKGVGMIHPNMATMLSVVLTDAAAPGPVGLLRPVLGRTWDQLSVDGDTSTNDTVFVLASGLSGAAPLSPDSPAAVALGAALEAVARDLARQQAADGEGADPDHRVGHGRGRRCRCARRRASCRAAW